jgi:predicted phage-related endonuclease
VSVEIETGVVDFDDNTAAWLENYKNALAKIKEWQEVADVARAHIEQSLGDAEVGMYQNRPVVRWSFIETRRFDIKRAKEILPPQVLDTLEVITNSRRFAIVEQENE